MTKIKDKYKNMFRKSHSSVSAMLDIRLVSLPGMGHFLGKVQTCKAVISSVQNMHGWRVFTFETLSEL